jgi:hypothetical protein
VDSDESDICNFLGSCGDQFVSALEISRRAANRKRFREEPRWAIQAIHRLIDQKVIESDGAGRYRLGSRQAEEKPTPKPKRWISPHIQKILNESGTQFDAMNPGPPEGDKKP